MTHSENLLTTEEAAVYLGLSAGSVARLRREGKGPTYLKSRHYVTYRKTDLDAWLEKTRRVVVPGVAQEA